MRRIIFGILPIVLIVGGIGHVQASFVNVTSLFNTGVDASGIQLANGSIGDPHYNLRHPDLWDFTLIPVLINSIYKSAYYN